MSHHDQINYFYEGHLFVLYLQCTYLDLLLGYLDSSIAQPLDDY